MSFLQGIDLGNLLIKTAVKRLKEEFPEMTKFSTLSPVPGFRAWLMNELTLAKRGQSKVLTDPEMERLRAPLSRVSEEQPAQSHEDVCAQLSAVLKANTWSQDDALVAGLENPLMRMCTRYLFVEKRRNFALNSVANFHLRNGATMWRINWLADMSPRGMDNSLGIMVNYRYFLDRVDTNSSQYLLGHEIAAGEQVLQLASQAREVMK